ncbi:hypothetical protein LTR85_002263 [Meristemomyces frigidus]|nr:hypothetical protein LTR85_002263 [Meristemomyces frigidus]
MSFTAQNSKMLVSSSFLICCILLPATARVLWIPAEFDPYEEPAIRARDTTTVSCGDSFPADFTCPASTTCLPLNTTSSIQAVLCCPAGQDCSVIQPVSCAESVQNATAYPDSELHADPTTALDACGSQCCPMGYSCQSDQCYAQSASAVSSSSSAAASSTTATPSTMASSTSTASTSSQSSPAPTADNSTLAYGTTSSSSAKFSGASFAAGFVPGIFLGAFLTACLLLILFRKKRSTSDSYMGEKQHSPRDTLTDLGTLSRRPTMHGRSISEPTADPSAGHRTDFLRGTPSRIPDGTTANHGYTVEAIGPVRPARTPKAVRALFSRSPFMNQTPSTPQSTQPPLPAHLKRGTLSFTISPVRALKKQKSMHSLRRQMTDASRGSNRRMRPDASRSGSTETIQVLMPSNEPYTPDQRPFRPIAEDAPATVDSSIYQPHESTSTWGTLDDSASPPQSAPAPVQYASSSRYPTQTITPTHMPRRSSVSRGGAVEGQLGTPYTPSRYYGNGKGRVTDVLVGDEGGLRVVRQPEKRDTTFSAMMEKAGLRRSDLVMGTGNR